MMMLAAEGTHVVEKKTRLTTALPALSKKNPRRWF
jgi:hypothetical protein